MARFAEERQVLPLALDAGVHVGLDEALAALELGLQLFLRGGGKRGGGDRGAGVAAGLDQANAGRDLLLHLRGGETAGGGDRGGLDGFGIRDGLTVRDLEGLVGDRLGVDLGEGLRGFVLDRVQHFLAQHGVLVFVERFDHPDKLAAGTRLDDQVHG
jgi:hypothetical protein